MAQNVRFNSGTKQQYLSILEHNPLALYFCDDTGELFKGDILLTDGVRVVPTRADLPSFDCAAEGVVYYIADTRAGFMVAPTRDAWLQTIYAPVDDVDSIPEGEEYNVVTTVGAVRDIEKKIYDKIDEVVVSGGLNLLTPVDGTIKIADTPDGGKSIGVAISSDVGNALVAVDGGLFVPTIIVPEYSIEKQAMAEDGFAASYKLKKVIGDDVSYVGDTINIAKDLVLKSATLETVTEDGVPYADAKVGDPYIKMVFNNEGASNLYIPVKDLVDTYTAGNCIEIIDNKISVKISNNAHGLVAVDGSLSINLATKHSDGAMSKEDKLIIDSIPYAYMSRKYDISGTPIGTLIDYRDHEIRIMCPSDAEFTKQNVGTGGDANSYYMTFKTYVSNDEVVGYIEHLGDQADSEILNTFSVDEYGRRYQPTWLALAKYDEATGSWTYYGKNSSVDKYIGWDYRIDWYNAEGIIIASDSVRINLSNENCHYSIKPYYLNEIITSEEVESIQTSIAKIEESYSWGEM